LFGKCAIAPRSSIAEINVFNENASTLDFDGDGQIVATKEGLVMLRAMLNLTGSAVT
jgi:hypothetical protein